MEDGIWLEVSRVQIEKGKVHVQVVGDRNDDKPVWRWVAGDAVGRPDGQATYNAIARGLDREEQTVIGRLKAVCAADPKPKEMPSGMTSSDLFCASIRIQTQ